MKKKQRVDYNGSFCQEKVLDIRVPQGSVFGPLLLLDKLVNNLPQALDIETELTMQMVTLIFLLN